MTTTANTQQQTAWPLPEELVDRARAAAFDTLVKWLEAANVPDEVVTLFQRHDSLEYTYAKLSRGEPYDPKEQDLVTEFAEAARLIAALGGAFNGGDYPEHVTENAQAWWKAEHK